MGLTLLCYYKSTNSSYRGRRRLPNLSTIYFALYFILFYSSTAPKSENTELRTARPVIMMPAEHALEFVTITNPDEIKDPVKQKAIRRQARRRDKDSKSSSRKPFKMTIDLPGGNVHSGREQPIVGCQTAAPYYTRPIYHENSQLDAEAPLFDFLLPMSSIGGGLVFTSPFSPEMNTRVLQLVTFSKHGF